ncbi:hypothetical protein ACFV1L_05125 [Kitasatospora sp. NPDC059646]|uniref:hypothetical protein n=1 Tax=Kitasatospora sp. NPDC059646 TaxID=3346893 RepID=UPI00367939B2
MPGDVESPELSEFLDEQAWAALRDWMKRTNCAVWLEDPGRIDGGGTDAAVLSVGVQQVNRAAYKALLKRCPPGRRPQRESEAHISAHAHAPKGFRQAHLLDQPCGPVPLPDDGCLVFQDVAFGGLRRTTLFERHVNSPLVPKICETVVTAVLGKWNTEPKLSRLKVGEVLAFQLAPRLAEGSKLARWARSVPGLWESESPGLRFPDGRILPNPLAMARGHRAFDRKLFAVHLGRAHGDLHPGNILLHTSGLDRRKVEFKLIDLASYGNELPLAHDPMTLLLSVADGHLPAGTQQRDALVRLLLAVDAEASDGSLLPTDLRETVQRVHRAGIAWAEPGNWVDEWQTATRLAIAANALLFVGWSKDPERQWWYLRLAAEAAGAVLEDHDPGWAPTEVFELPAPTPPTTPAARTPPDPPAPPSPVPPQRRADEASEAALRNLERHSRAALRAAQHHEGVSLGDTPLDLSTLYVERDLEQPLLHLLGEGESACVVGAPGAGKTTLLWRLHALLSEAGGARQPYLLRAGDLCDREADRRDGSSVSVEQLRAAAPLLNGRAIFLVDTADVLLSRPDGAELLQDLLAFTADHSIPLLLTSREAESRQLRALVQHEGLDWKHLSAYSDREQDDAVRRHAEYFYTGNTEVSVDEVYRAVTAAAVKGLPLREVCRVPLTLRLLFEVSAPGLPDVAEVDSTNLYDRYWQHRVHRDLRAGARTAPTESADVSRTAEALAELMLTEGRPELPAATVTSRLPVRMAVLRARNEATPGLDALLSRGVVERQGEGSLLRYSFVHQTLFEYAAGHGLCSLEEHGDDRPVGRLLDWLRENPNDQFRLAVLEQALVQAGRAGGSAGTRAEALLEDLAGATAPEHNHLALLLRVYARLPQPGPALRAAMARVLPGLSVEHAHVYLEALPGVCHRDPTRLSEELDQIWHDRDATVRWAVVEVLGRFAESFPEAAVAAVDLTCPRRTARRKPGVCGPTTCDPDRCLWAWLIAKIAGRGTNPGPALHLLEALAEKDPAWVWPRLRSFFTDFRQDLRPLARSLRLAARPYAWPEAPYPLVRGMLRRRWSGDSTRNDDAIGLQAALGRITAAAWRARPADRQPPLERVLRAAARRPNALLSHAQMRAVGECALRATPEQAEALLAAAIDCSTDENKALLTDGLLAPLLTDGKVRTDLVGGAPPAPSRADGRGGGAAVIRGWLATQLRTLADPSPAVRPAPLAVHTWGRALPVDTVSALLAEAWPDGARGSSVSADPPTADVLERVWLTDQAAGSLLVAGTAAGHAHAIAALRLWREQRAAGGRGKAGRSVDRPVTTCLQRLLPRHPGLVDHLFAGGTFDHRLDPKWLGTSLRKADGKDQNEITIEDARLTAALRRHSGALTTMCLDGWFGRQGEAARQSAPALWGRLLERGITDPPSHDLLIEALRRRGDLHARKATLLLAQTVLEHTPSGALTPARCRELDVEFRRTAEGEGEPERRGPSLKWQERCQAVARQCRIVLVCRHHPVASPAGAREACRAAQRHVLTAAKASDVTVVGRLLERLAVEAPDEAVALFGTAAERLSSLSGSTDGVIQRWHRPIADLAARTDRRQWEELVRSSRLGPARLQRALIRSSISRRMDDPAAFLLATASASENRVMVVETVRIAQRLNARGGSGRWTGLEPAAPLG